MTTTATNGSTETTQRCDFNKVRPGNVFSRHSFGTVVSMIGNRLQLRNSDGYEWTIDSNILEQEFSFAEQHDAEEQVSRTRIIEILTENPRTAMTVNFNKKPDPKAVAKEISAGQEGMSDRAWANKVKKLLEGEERTMIGWHFGSFDEHRRLHFTESGTGGRLVDPRTINWIVLNRMRYVVK